MSHKKAMNGRGPIQPIGDLLTVVANYLLNGMILQVWLYLLFFFQRF